MPRCSHNLQFVVPVDWGLQKAAVLSGQASSFGPGVVVDNARLVAQ